MLIIVKDDTDKSYLPILDKVDSNRLEFARGEKTDKELLALKPDVLILAHHDVVAQCRSLISLGRRPYYRILALLPGEISGQVIQARIAGADWAMLAPASDSDLRHAARNELAIVRRFAEAEKLVAGKALLAKQYELQKVLGVSLRAAVYLAEDRNTHKKVTVKHVRKMLAGQPGCVNDFLEEAELIAKARTPYIPEILDIGKCDSTPFIVYDIGEAKNLFEHLRENDNLSEIELLRIALSVTRALYTLKQHKIFHLNIKPENILFLRGKYYLVDFGILPEMNAPLDNTCFPYWSDAAYASPEFFSPEADLTARTDVYSLGVLLYTLAMRQNPFAGYHYKIAYQRHLHGNLLEFPAKCSFSSSFVTTVYSMTMLRQEARPWLRDLEIMFSLSLKLRSGPATAKPIQTIDSFLEKTRNLHDLEHQTSSLSPGETRLLGHTHNTDDDQVKCKRPPARKKAGGAVDRLLEFVLENWKAVLAILLGVPLLFLTGLLLGKLQRKPVYFHQGAKIMFTCYKGHTHSGRTLDFRTFRCQKCGDRTSPSCTCADCRKVFGQSLWPLRNMTEEECAKFEEKIKRCPYCRSRRIYPTPLRN